ncbi:hypothetical protein CLOM621_07774 [Clostridium sp. M62/1]|nr:hypothetical protein CLOM621_07774 [Clostridium sp. M62/1]
MHRRLFKCFSSPWRSMAFYNEISLSLYAGQSLLAFPFLSA